jgi:hypothetical protein
MALVLRSHGIFNYKGLKIKLLCPPWDPNQLKCVALDVESSSTKPH